MDPASRLRTCPAALRPSSRFEIELGCSSLPPSFSDIPLAKSLAVLSKLQKNVWEITKWIMRRIFIVLNIMSLLQARST